MTRQIALGAVIAFGITVLVLSVWEPRPPAPVVPAATLVPAAAPIVVAPLHEKPLRPLSLRPESINTMVRRPQIPLQVIDAGVPAP